MMRSYKRKKRSEQHHTIQAQTAQSIFSPKPFGIEETSEVDPSAPVDPQAQLEQARKGFKFADISIRPPSQASPTIQREVTVGKANDKYEKEADQVASEVVESINSPNSEDNSGSQGIQNKEQSVQRQINPLGKKYNRPIVPRNDTIERSRIKPLERRIPREEKQLYKRPNPLIQRLWIQKRSDIDESQLAVKPSYLQRQGVEQEEEVQMKPQDTIQLEETKEDEELQMKPQDNLQREGVEGEDDLQMKPNLQRVGHEGGVVSQNLESKINSAKGGGQSLDKGLQKSMGQAMGADFSRVRIHTDAQSDRLNQSIQAKAFTTGSDVFFKQGAYQPESRSGQTLIAHELTHVVQQSRLNNATGKPGQMGNRGEVTPQPQLTGSAQTIQREWDEVDNAQRRVDKFKDFIFYYYPDTGIYRWADVDQPELLSAPHSYASLKDYFDNTINLPGFVPGPCIINNASQSNNTNNSSQSNNPTSTSSNQDEQTDNASSTQIAKSQIQAQTIRTRFNNLDQTGQLPSGFPNLKKVAEANPNDEGINEFIKLCSFAYVNAGKIQAIFENVEVTEETQVAFDNLLRKDFVVPLFGSKDLLETSKKKGLANWLKAGLQTAEQKLGEYDQGKDKSNYNCFVTDNLSNSKASGYKRKCDSLLKKPKAAQTFEELLERNLNTAMQTGGNVRSEKFMTKEKLIQAYFYAKYEADPNHAIPKAETFVTDFFKWYNDTPWSTIRPDIVPTNEEVSKFYQQKQKSFEAEQTVEKVNIEEVKCNGWQSLYTKFKDSFENWKDAMAQYKAAQNDPNHFQEPLKRTDGKLFKFKGYIDGNSQKGLIFELSTD